MSKWPTAASMVRRLTNPVTNRRIADRWAGPVNSIAILAWAVETGQVPPRAALAYQVGQRLPDDLVRDYVEEHEDPYVALQSLITEVQDLTAEVTLLRQKSTPTGWLYWFFEMSPDQATKIAILQKIREWGL